MSAILNLALKDLRLLVIDKMGIFWFLVFPLIFALFFGTLIGGEKNNTTKMKLAVVDADQSPESKRFIEQLEKSEALAVTPMDRGEAEAKVRKGEQTAFIVIPKEFGKSGSFFGGNQTSIEEGLDPSRRAEAGYLEGLLMEALFQKMTDRFSDPSRSKDDIQQVRKEVEKTENSKQKQLLLGFFNDLDKFLGQADFGSFKDEKGQGRAFAKPQIKKIDITLDETGKFSSPFEITFPASLVWGLYGCVMTFAISLVTERTRGTMLRLRTTPMTWTQILAGKGLACFIACFAITSLLLTIGAVFFSVRITHPFGLLVALTVSSLGFTGMMLFVSTLGKTERAVAGASSGIFMPLAMIGGGMIPLIAMPDWLQKAASISPFKWGILAFEGSIWRNFSWGDYLLPSVMLLLFGGVGFVVGAYWLTKTEMA
jgi:ABC-2 type transport system permease protein